MRYGSRYPSRSPMASTSSCVACGGPLPSRRAQYCSDACKQRAYRLRHVDLAAAAPDLIGADLRRRGQAVAHTVYECPACEARYLGTRRCPECNRFCRALGPGGTCPHCDEPVLITDLLES